MIKGLVKRPDYKLCLCVLDEKIEFPELFDHLNDVYIFKRGNKFNIHLLLELSRIALKFRPDVVHTWDAIASFYANFLKFQIKFFYLNNTIRWAQPKDFFSVSDKLLFNLNFFFSNIVVANSFAGLKLYAPAKKGAVVYNGFDLQRASIQESVASLKEEYKIKSDKVVGMVANITDLKDYSTFINAAAIISKKRDDTVFLAVGTGNKINETKNLVTELKLDQQFIFMEEHNQIERIIKTFDVGVLSSFSEGMSNSIMEYMALAKPVVATDSGGTREIIIDGETGFLTKPKDCNDLAEKIEFLLVNSEKSIEFGLNGLSRISIKFGLEQMVNNYISLYNSGKL